MMLNFYGRIDMYTCDIKRMEDKIKTFSKFGDTGHGGITK